MSKNKMTRSEAGALGAKASREIIKKKKEKRIKRYNLDPKLCQTCNEGIPYEKRVNIYCNKSCRAKRVNKERERKDNRTIVECLVCGNKTKNEKFCSKPCFGKNKRDVLLNKIRESGDVNFEGDKMDGNIDERNRTRARILLIEEYGNVCQICKNTEWMDKEIPLTVDHINGNAGDNKLENLRMVCPNCDRQLPTFGSKNRGNGRPYRYS
jgi:hypothetical protein